MTFRARYCSTCATPLRRGTYLRCVLGCGAFLCRKGRGCPKRHVPNCPVRQANSTMTRTPA